MNVTPPTGSQNTEVTSSRQVEVAPVQRYFLSRWLVKIVDAISHLFGLRSPFFHETSRPDDVKIDERSTSVRQAIDTQPVVMPEKTVVTQSAVDLSVEKSVTKPSDKKAEETPVYRRQQKPIRQNKPKRESRSDELRRKKRERKERRLEEKRQLHSEQLNETTKPVHLGPKSHKMQRMERKEAVRAELQAQRDDIRQLMNMDFLTEDEQVQQDMHRASRDNRREFARMAAINVTETTTTNVESPTPEVKTDFRAMRIPNEDMPAMVNTPENDYQQTVATLFNRLKQERDDQGQLLLSSSAEFQVCFAPLISDPELDIEEAVTAFANFKKLQSIQSEVEGAYFPEVAFAVLFELGELERDPLEFEDVIVETADLEPEFESIAENNEFYRKAQYCDLVTRLFGDIQDDLVEREEQLLKATMDNDSAIASPGEPFDAEIPDAEHSAAATLMAVADQLQKSEEQPEIVPAVVQPAKNRKFEDVSPVDSLYSTPGNFSIADDGVEESEVEVTDRLNDVARKLGSEVANRKAAGFGRQDSDGYDSGVEIGDDEE